MEILVIEPFYGGSHAQLIDVLAADSMIGSKLKVFTLPAKKWHWRARTSALHFMQSIPPCSNYSLVADAVVFNSEFNKESFLKSISSHLKLMPDYRPKDLEAKIRPKCRVINFPVDFQGEHKPDNKDSTSSIVIEHVTNTNTLELNISDQCGADKHSCDEKNEQTTELIERNHESIKADEDTNTGQSKIKIQPSLQCDSCLHIVWPHRWEHDKDPDTFFQVLFQLLDEGYVFKVSVLGESYQEIPEVFDVAKNRLGNRVVAWGFQDRDVYRAILDDAHVAVSTANHEFFGVSMLEATSRGCFPLCPKRLVYPEIYPDECLYSTQAQLVKRLKNFCRRPDKIQCPKINLKQFTWEALKKDYYNVLKCDA